MNTLKIIPSSEFPVNYTGIVEQSNGDLIWYYKGKVHREDGPAIDYPNGYKAWYLNGIKYSQEEWFEMLSDEDKLEAIWNLR
jgi:hypothetical protein